MIDFQECMGKNIPKLETLKTFVRLNMQQPREEHDEALNALEDNGAK